MKATVLPAQYVPGGYAAPFVGGPPNESLKGAWWILEFIPKSYRDPAANFEKRWMIHAGRHRHVAAGAAIHPSVRERMSMNLDPPYNPPNLPPNP